MGGEEEKGSWMVKGRKKMGERKWRSQGEKIKEKRKV